MNIPSTFCSCRSFLFVVLALAISSAACAQIGVYGMASGGHYSGIGVGVGTGAQSGGITAYGGTFGVYDDFVPMGPVKLGGDGRVFVQNSANSTMYGNKLVGGLFGLRLEVSAPVIPFRPYLQAEIGGVGTNNGDSTTRSGSFAYQVQGGLDVTLLPHLAARGEYGAGQLTATGGTNHTLQEFGVGLVLRL
jgi:hypothetical protein